MKKVVLFLSLVTAVFITGCAKKPAQPATEAAAVENTSEQADAQKTGSTATSTSVVKTIPANVHGEDILKAIKENYKGKVALIDFWATWCPPCRQAMKSVDEIKPELEKKGCTFVYVTGETSPLDKWNAMIPEISGEHYRLTNQQWEELCEHLNIPGIPAYMLIGKDGKTVFDNLSQGGYPGNEILKNNIEVALTK